MKILLPSLLALLMATACHSLKAPQLIPEIFITTIRINQVGYYPNGTKKAVIAKAVEGETFQVFNLKNMKKVYSGKLSSTLDWELAGETVRIADFSALTKPGRYSVFVKGVGYSYPFAINEKVYQSSLAAALKSYYYQRASMPLDEKFAGKWHRPAGHPDNEVIFHASSGRAGTTSSPGGWYDAGDYGKYTVNAAFSLGQMLFLYEQYPGILPDGVLNIPESGNGVSDLLDELKYEMDWLLSMQDNDGGMFFKLTSLRFGGMVLPHKDGDLPRYIIGKSTTAALNFAAVAAKMSRAFGKTDTDYSERCLSAAQKAWDWAVTNPNVSFKNPKDVSTGEYGDMDFSGEFFWAAAELYASTKEAKYLPFLQQNLSDFKFVEGESWANFQHMLGAFTLVEHVKDAAITAVVRESLMATADELVAQVAHNDYLQPIDDFQWGSTSDVLNAAMILAQAYRINPKPIYLSAIQETTDYIFGKNATGYCFLTGFGSKSPLFIHHRPSAADGIEEPVPGLLSGGPNYGKHDAGYVKYTENAPPMKCWADEEPSFASNEVCINWNSALVYVLGFLEAETKTR